MHIYIQKNKVEPELKISMIMRFWILLAALCLSACQPLTVYEDRRVPNFAPTGLDKVSWLKDDYARTGAGRDERLKEISRLIEPMISAKLDSYGIAIQAAGSTADWRVDYRLVSAFIPSKDAGQPEVEQAARMHDPVGTGFDLRGDSSNRAPGIWTYQLHMSVYSGFQEKAVWFGRIENIRAPDGVEALPKSSLKAAVNQLIATLFNSAK